jgi:hypothetical protein
MAHGAIRLGASKNIVGDSDLSIVEGFSQPENLQNDNERHNTINRDDIWCHIMGYLGCAWCADIGIMMMDQFRLCKAMYAGYTLFYIVLLDDEGYNVSEHTIRSESNNIRLNQNFR